MHHAIGTCNIKSLVASLYGPAELFLNFCGTRDRKADRAQKVYGKSRVDVGLINTLSVYMIHSETCDGKGACEALRLR